jgi:TPR repeat protein
MVLPFLLSKSYRVDLSPQKWLRQATTLANDQERFTEFLDFTLASAKDGDVNAQVDMGKFSYLSILHCGGMLCSTNSELVPEATYWYEKASEIGNPFATYALGMIKITGKTESILNPNSEDQLIKEKVSCALLPNLFT